MRRAGAMMMVVAAGLALAGCGGGPQGARVGVGTPPGLLYTYVQAPMGAPSGGDGPPRVILPDDYKTGTASFRSFALKGPPGLTPGLPGIDPISVGWGEGAWKKAMENGGLEEAYFADYRELKILFGIYQDYEITVYGR